MFLFKYWLFRLVPFLVSAKLWNFFSLTFFTEADALCVKTLYFLFLFWTFNSHHWTQLFFHPYLAAQHVWHTYAVLPLCVFQKREGILQTRQIQEEITGNTEWVQVFCAAILTPHCALLHCWKILELELQRNLSIITKLIAHLRHKYLSLYTFLEECVGVVGSRNSELRTTIVSSQNSQAKITPFNRPKMSDFSTRCPVFDLTLKRPGLKIIKNVLP